MDAQNSAHEEYELTAFGGLVIGVLVTAVLAAVVIWYSHRTYWVERDIGAFSFAAHHDNQGISDWQLSIEPSVWKGIESKVDLRDQNKLGPLVDIVNDAIRDPSLCAGGWNFDSLKRNALRESKVVIYGHCERGAEARAVVDRRI